MRLVDAGKGAQLPKDAHAAKRREGLQPDSTAHHPRQAAFEHALRRAGDERDADHDAPSGAPTTFVLIPLPAFVPVAKEPLVQRPEARVSFAPPSVSATQAALLHPMAAPLAGATAPQRLQVDVVNPGAALQRIALTRGAGGQVDLALTPTLRGGESLVASAPLLRARLAVLGSTLGRLQLKPFARNDDELA